MDGRVLAWWPLCSFPLETFCQLKDAARVEGVELTGRTVDAFNIDDSVLSKYVRVKKRLKELKDAKRRTRGRHSKLRRLVCL